MTLISPSIGQASDDGEGIGLGKLSLAAHEPVVSEPRKQLITRDGDRLEVRLARFLSDRHPRDTRKLVMRDLDAVGFKANPETVKAWLSERSFPGAEAQRYLMAAYGADLNLALYGDLILSAEERAERQLAEAEAAVAHRRAELEAARAHRRKFLGLD